MRHLYDSSLASATSSLYVTNDLSDVSAFVDQYPGRSLYVVDEHTRLFLPSEQKNVVVLSSGEEHKNWLSIETILRNAKELQMGRDDYFVALGGGVVCDLTAFAASIYMRGARLILIPTTLLAMVDASLGGKSAIDLFQIKNLAGTFYPAQSIILCPAYLATLTQREFKSGLSEVIKHALLTDQDELFLLLSNKQEAIERRDVQVMEEVLLLSLAVKRHYVENDPLERSDIRAALNFGHTFAHALESTTGFSAWTHGEAVAWGAVKALEAGLALQLSNADFVRKGRALFHQYDFTLEIPIIDLEGFLRALQSDKKQRGGKKFFVLLKDFGEVVTQPLESDLLRRLLT